MLASSLVLSVSPDTQTAAAPSASLKAAAAGTGIYVGSQFKGAEVTADATYKAVHTHQFSLSTVGNNCKWAETEAKEGQIDLTKCNAAYSYARSAKQAFRAHNLCWGNNNPQWLLQKKGADELRVALKSHIVGVMQGIKRAAGGVSPYAYDVVNEATNDTAWYKPNTWYPALPDYVDLAFTTARAADNDTLLFYNDFGVAGNTKKSDQMYAMVASMVKRGIPIDGVGLQSHFTLSSEAAPQGLVEERFRGEEEYKFEDAPTEAAISQNIARYGALGLQVHITEMDVKCPDPCDSDALEAQAEVYADALRACLAHPKVCTSFETWGFTDKYTWLVGSRCPTTKCHPLPLDENYEPKPAFTKILSVLKNHKASAAPAA